MTYSLVAFDARSGRRGSAVASRSVAVGGSVVYSRLGVGLVNTQHRAHLFIGEMALNEMERGLDPQSAVERILRKDAKSDVRQIIALDVQNRIGVWTGDGCNEAKGQIVCDACAVAGNMLASREVLEEMRRAFERNAELNFGLRLLTSLEAGERVGGDRRGTRSAAIKVVPPPDSRTAVNLDLRVDDHDDPLGELRRIYTVFREEFPRTPDPGSKGANPTSPSP